MSESQLDLVPYDDDDVPDAAELADVPQAAWSKVLAGMVDTLSAGFRRRGASVEDATEEAQFVVIELANYCGGREMYLPRGQKLMKALRDRRIYLEHTGRNERHLAERYNITPRQVRQIHREQRALQVARRQGRLFGT